LNLPSPGGKLPAAQSAETLEAAITGGKMSLDMRYRYEFVDDKKPAPQVPLAAHASTLRTRLGYATALFEGIGAAVEMENITVLGDEHYNSTVNGLTQYATVSDPKGTEINQAYLSYAGLGDTLAKFGRQRLTLDNHRWIGNVGWRQNEQTYDGLSVVNTSLPDTRVTYANLYGINRVFGTTSTAGRYSADANLLNVAYSGLGMGTLVGYGYWLDLSSAPTQSSRTLGVRFSGKQSAAEGLDALYAVEFARQHSYAGNPASFNLDYRLAELGATAKGITGMLGYELLDSDGTNAVQTPLATLHAMNGWADKFLTTPAAGLKDVSASLGTTLADIKLIGAYHDFSAASGGTDYGKEWDLHAWYPFGKYNVGTKYASYRAQGFSFDTDKFWLYGELKF
jgi:hypothetical protein